MAGARIVASAALAIALIPRAAIAARVLDRRFIHRRRGTPSVIVPRRYDTGQLSASAARESPAMKHAPKRSTSKDQPKQVPRVVQTPPVRNMAELRELLRSLTAQHARKKLLLRGQANLYPHIRSGRARPETKMLPELEKSWSSFASRMFGVGAPDEPLVKAILQHYGAPTHYVDLTEDPEVAFWFAINQYRSGHYSFVGNCFRTIDTFAYERAAAGTGYVLVLAIPDHRELQAADLLFNLSKLPKAFVRPHRQAGWLMYDRPPLVPVPDDYWVATIPVDRAGASTNLNQADLFPPPAQDPAYQALVSLPFVQVPVAFFPDKPKTGEGDLRKTSEQSPDIALALEKMCIAERVIPVAEAASGHGELVNHKWRDLTLYEPHAVRTWCWWKFPLSHAHHGIRSGDIHDATKITLSPEANGLMKRSRSNDLHWPDLGSDDLFFSFAVWDHDKVIDHAPPYEGVWLHREDDLIVEHPMMATEDVLAVGSGHAFLLRDGKLLRRDIVNACRCGKPETHVRRVAAVLRMTTMIERGRLTLLPHPMRLPRWFVAI